MGDDEIYDSLNLFISYDSYFYGDTTLTQKITIHQLKENIRKNNEGYLSNKKTFTYNPDPIGSIIYSPHPNNDDDTLLIKINDEIGRDLFTKLIEHSDIILNEETFINYFHGLVLIPDESYKGSIIGFYASSVSLKLYTSRNGVTEEKYSYMFPLADTSYQFNNIKHDFSSSIIKGLTEQKNMLTSESSNGLSFIQGGVGLAIRADLPSLSELLLRQRGTFIKAQLSIKPLIGSYQKFALSNILYIAKTNKLNIGEYLLTNPVSSLTMDELYQEESTYTFDVTDYIAEEISDSYVDPGSGLMIILQDSDLTSTFNRLIIDAKESKLKIYYLSY